MRVVVTHIGQDGTMLRRVVDTARCADGPRWEGLATRALLLPPPYHPVPGAPVYHVSVDNGMMALAAEHDLCGPLLDLVIAVLAMGDDVLPPLPGSFANRSTTPAFQLIGEGTLPYQLCTVVGVTAPETVNGIKGNPHATHTIRVFAMQSVNTQAMADSGPVITKADNGILQPLPIIRPPSFTNGGGPVTFIADLVDSGGNIIATASSVNTRAACSARPLPGWKARSAPRRGQNIPGQ